MLLQILFQIFLATVPVNFEEIILTESPEQQVVTPEPDHIDYDTSSMFFICFCCFIENIV